MAEYTYWNIYIYGSAGEWESDGTIRKPNDNLSLNVTSTQTKVVLADGSNAFVNPEVLYTKDSLNFIWMEDDGDLKAQIESYIANGDYIKIVSETAGDFIGRFTSVSVVWLKGVADTFDISAIFERME